MKNLSLDFYLLLLHDKINTDKCEMQNFLHELEHSNVKTSHRIC
jgi:hypothetical protein